MERGIYREHRGSAEHPEHAKGRWFQGHLNCMPQHLKSAFAVTVTEGPPRDARLTRDRRAFS